MNKKIFLSLGILFLLSVILNLGFVSAGLCKGSDGYYHDCDDFSDSYYNHNFHPSYKTEYYSETSSSSSSIISITEDRNSYEKISASSSEESNIEIIKIERDYSHPKSKYTKDKYYDYWDKWLGDDETEETSYDKYQENHESNLIFLGGSEEYNDYDEDYDWSDWRNKKSYNSRYYDEDKDEYNDYYYEPRYSESKGYYNWGW
ncbi:MAG: hypothetical protein WCX73_03065 [Candidatus Pacearchaeota archaeon]|jgi:hypothetical protein